MPWRLAAINSLSAGGRAAFHRVNQILALRLKLEPSMRAPFFFQMKKKVLLSCKPVMGWPKLTYQTNLKPVYNAHVAGVPREVGLSRQNLKKGVDTGNYYYGARYYDPKISVWLSVDPLYYLDPAWSPYNFSLNNPILHIDPDGRSTHTDAEGNVVAVYYDDDLGVYKHDDLSKWDGESTLKIEGKGVTNMGETEYWDEFVNPETGLAMTETKIQYNTSWDGLVKEMGAKAKNMDLTEVMLESLPGGEFDIKVKYANTGSKLNGKYASSRSAGNYAAGQNAALASFGMEGVQISFNGFQRMAGALHKGRKWGLTQYILYGKTYGEAPYYGEIPYQYRMSKSGWESTGRN